MSLIDLVPGIRLVIFCEHLCDHEAYFARGEAASFELWGDVEGAAVMCVL